ncbi:hypothetical protein N8H74_24490 [Pseudomonas sp. B2M1-30]|uniref:Uncharacterized protein n=1 Tax=Pseudomonas koreensis TaxID=198620 RepID=A0A9X3BDB3_9PSED|nr:MULTISPECIES: hypothetical protein [Pseudomonas]MBV4477458.1 hypothetical protein [Pseudomonas botevensis]MCU0121436.1 hypothetical protein [Pseudomonas sp. B2M1-30]MCU7250445.1 hypothetical protein [Pseudomonas koreensis]MCU7263676.1 hypothetical protein [Pseudomonas koreensis]
MTIIGTPGPGNSGIASLVEVTDTSAAVEPVTDASAMASPTLVDSVKVSLSGAAIARSAGAGGNNRDIEASDLPENVQQLLKMIRKLQQQIAEKNALINQVMLDSKLSNEERLAKVAAFRSAIAALNTGLITANLSLAKVVTQSNMTPDQNMKTGELLTKI